MAPTPMAISPDAVDVAASRRHPVATIAVRATRDAMSGRTRVLEGFGRRVSIHAEDDLAEMTQTQRAEAFHSSEKARALRLEHFFANTRFCASIFLASPVSLGLASAC